MASQTIQPLPDLGLSAPAPTTTKPERLLSLDVFRGITIAGMILVNNPGSWKCVYAPLGHAKWNGWTPTDLVFPFFLFIVGVAMTFSFQRRLEQGHSRPRLLGQVARRAIILFCLGLIMFGFRDFLDPLIAGHWPSVRLIGPYVLVILGLAFLFADEPPLGLGAAGAVRVRKIVAWVLLIGAVVYFALNFSYFQESKLRVPGVLQRIALCYFFAALVVMTCRPWARALWAVVLLAGYWWIVKYVSPPAGYAADVVAPDGLLHNWIDGKLLGNHLYGGERPDPEGLLSTIPAIATVLLGVLTGHWLQSRRDRIDKVIGLFFAANVALVIGLWMNHGFAINKKIWTSSYVVFTAGLALHFLAMCYWLIDVKGFRRWAWPFAVLGSNAIVVYFLSSVTAVVLGKVMLNLPDGGTIALKPWVYEHLLAPYVGPWNGSLLYAISYVVVWCLLMIPLYRLRIFVKV